MSIANLTQLLPSLFVELEDFSADMNPIDLSNAELSRVALDSLNNAYVKSLVETELPVQSGQSPSKARFRLLTNYLGISTNFDIFFDQETLTRAATAVFRGLAVHLAQGQLLQPEKVDGFASVVVNPNRLDIRIESLVAMIVCFVLMFRTAVAIMILVRRRVVPQHPGSITSYSTILSKSPALNQILGEMGSLKGTHFKRSLQGRRFKVVSSNKEFSIGVERISEEPVRQDTKMGTGDWVPPAAKIYRLVLLLIFSLVLICVLEVLQRLSDRNDGFSGESVLCPTLSVTDQL